MQDRFWHRKPAGELYNMAEDPDALHNLAEAPAHAATLDEMRGALDAHMIAIHDCGFIPEGSAVEAREASRETARRDPHSTFTPDDLARMRQKTETEAWGRLVEQDRQIALAVRLGAVLRARG